MMTDVNDTSLTGLTAVVTGGAKGIGLGITRSLAARGANVLVVGRSQETLSAAVGSLAGMPGSVAGFAADVADPQACSAIIGRADELFGGVDLLCANAGIFPETPLEELSATDIEGVFRTNVFGTMHLVRAAVPLLKRSARGRVVLTSSITGPMTGFPGWSHYGASKAAQLGFMRSAALELAPWGITVNAVLPGNVATEGLADMGEDYIASMTASVPLGRLGFVDEIGETAAFLCSPGAAFITGQSIVVDGGQTLPECPDAILDVAAHQEVPA